jgi:hypothetical protein
VEGKALVAVARRRRNRPLRSRKPTANLFLGIFTQIQVALHKFGRTETERDDDLATALIECKAFGRRGHILASDVLTLLRRVVRTVSNKVQGNITNLTNSNFSDNATSQSMVAQLSAIRSNFEMLPDQLDKDINAISKTSFSITLFGRTMAGKSTLMEILTQGNGGTIGCGAQRMTRDVRTYTYKDLIITDIPGIAAFEGQEDEDEAFYAAKKCDLILFLITDDAPQAREAECMNRILALGKPVVCLINVKTNIDSPLNLKLFIRDIQKKMDKERLDIIKKQFFDFGTQYGQDWRKIRFAYVHLKSAFLSQQNEFADIDIRGELYTLSRFNYVKNLIVSEVVNKGSFYKLKAFSDIVAVPVVGALETLFSQSTQNTEQGVILISKRRKLQKWTEEFEKDGKRRIDSFLSTISSELKREIASFAEENYDNSDASREWDKVLKARNIESRSSALLKQLDSECKEELREISREIDSEIKFSHSVFSDSSINMHMLLDEKRIWNWATGLVSGGLMIAGIFGLLTGPVGLIGLGVGLIGWVGSFLFSDREKKTRDARQKLEKKLSAHINKMITDLKKKILDALYNDLLKRQLYSMSKTIDEVIDSLFLLSQTQQEFAVALNNKLKELNTAVVKEALGYLEFAGLERHIMSIARVPGYAMMIVLENGKHFPDDAKNELSHLFKEHVWFVFYSDNLKFMLSQAIGRGCNKNTISIQNIHEIPRIAHIPSMDILDASTKNRIRLAQQLTELLIMK